MTTIKLKNGSGAPTSGDLAQGEPALDLTNKRLYTEDSGGTVIEVGTNPGVDVTFADNRKAIFGAGSDLQIYHDGSNSYIDDGGTGNLRVRANSLELTNADYTQSYLQAVVAGPVSLFYNGSARLATTSTGIDVTGTATMDGLVSSGDSTIGGSSATSNVLLDLVEPTSSSDIILGVSANGSGRTQIRSTQGLGTSSDFRLLTVDSGSTRERLKIANNGDISFYEDTGTTAKFFWDASAERLGIGTSSPSNPLHVATASTDVAKFATTGAYNFISLDNATRNWALSVGSTFSIYDATAASTRMSIDASGNLLVGTTNVNPAANNVTGHAIKAGGLVEHANSGAMVMRLNRTDSSGSIIEFRQGTSAVGSIGVRANFIKIGNGDTHLLFNSSADAVTPEGATDNRDAAIDLGRSVSRFKDLYLSGGAYLGGTGSANKLDDYEEGTWTPTLEASTTNPTPTAVTVNNATYTKVGRMVHIQAYITVNLTSTGSGGAQITGLPFTVGTGYAPVQFVHGDLILSNGGYFNNSSTKIIAITNNSTSSIGYAGTGTKGLMISGTYEVA